MRWALVTAPRFGDEIKLVATRAAINCAGLFAVSTLTKWGARSILRDSALVTEALVTSVVKATGVMDARPHWTEIEHLNLITVRLLGLESSVVIEVWDADTDTPTQPAPAGSVVNRGSYRAGGGKVVWAELALMLQPHTEPDLLRRVREGLDGL